MRPNGWATVTVADVGSVQLGLKKSPDKNTGRGRTKYVRAANITQDGLDLTDVSEMDFTPSEQRLYRLRAGDLVLAEASGSPSHVGRAAIWADEIPNCCYQMTVLRFRPHATIPRYALLVFRHHSMTGEFARASRGVGIQHLSASRLSQMSFPLPPLAEQERIVAEFDRRRGPILETRASLSTALGRITEQDREILATAVTGGLVESEATLAKREKGPAEAARAILGPAKTLLDEVDDDHEATEAQDGLRSRSLPPGWCWVNMSEVGEVRLGRQLSPKQRQGRNLRRYLRVANVFEDFIDTTDVKEMNFTADEFKEFRLQKGDVLLNEGQSIELVGRPAIFRGEVKDACFQNTLIRFRPIEGVESEYALLVFRHYLHSGEFQKIARRSTNIAHLGLSRFAEMPFPLPPTSEQRRIVEEANKRLTASRLQHDSVTQAITRADDMEKELLAAAVTGSLVPQSDKDEDATEYLKRLGSPPSDRLEVEEAASVEDSGTPLPPIIEGNIRPLTDILRESKRAMRLPDLFAQAGYDKDDAQHIEQFYLALRGELGRTIRQSKGSEKENALLEATDAAR